MRRVIKLVKRKKPASIVALLGFSCRAGATPRPPCGELLVQTAVPNQNKSLPQTTPHHASPRQHEPAPTFSLQPSLKELSSARQCVTGSNDPTDEILKADSHDHLTEDSTSRDTDDSDTKRRSHGQLCLDQRSFLSFLAVWMQHVTSVPCVRGHTEVVRRAAARATLLE